MANNSGSHRTGSSPSSRYNSGNSQRPASYSERYNRPNPYSGYLPPGSSPAEKIYHPESVDPVRIKQLEREQEQARLHAYEDKAHMPHSGTASRSQGTVQRQQRTQTSRSTQDAARRGKQTRRAQLAQQQAARASSAPYHRTPVHTTDDAYLNEMRQNALDEAERLRTQPIEIPAPAPVPQAAPTPEPVPEAVVTAVPASAPAEKAAAEPLPVAGAAQFSAFLGSAAVSADNSHNDSAPTPVPVVIPVTSEPVRSEPVVRSHVPAASAVEVINSDAPKEPEREKPAVVVIPSVESEDKAAAPEKTDRTVAPQESEEPTETEEVIAQTDTAADEIADETADDAVSNDTEDTDSDESSDSTDTAETSAVICDTADTEPEENSPDEEEPKADIEEASEEEVEESPAESAEPADEDIVSSEEESETENPIPLIADTPVEDTEAAESDDTDNAPVEEISSSEAEDAAEDIPDDSLEDISEDISPVPIEEPSDENEISDDEVSDDEVSDEEEEDDVKVYVPPAKNVGSSYEPEDFDEDYYEYEDEEEEMDASDYEEAPLEAPEDDDDVITTAPVVAPAPAPTSRRRSFETRISSELADPSTYSPGVAQDETLFIRKKRPEEATAVFSASTPGLAPDFDDDDFFEQWLEEGDDMIIKDKRQRRRVSAIIGGATMIFAIIGFIFVVVWFINGIPTGSSSSGSQTDYASFILPVVNADPEPFETISSVDNNVLVEASINRLTYGEAAAEHSYTALEVENETRLLIPASDVEKSGKILFGEEFTIDYANMYSIEDEKIYYYSAADECFHVITTSGDIEPQIIKISHIGSRTQVILEVGYISATEENMEDSEYYKMMEYVLNAVDGGYYISAVRAIEN